MTYLHILKGEMRKLWSNRAFLLLLLLLAWLLNRSPSFGGYNEKNYCMCYGHYIAC